MRIACLQFAPVLGDVDNNLNRADSVLDHADPEDLDLLVLPELAFSGYNFKSLGDISRYLEPAGTGISSLWARSQALKHDCTVVVGYPEKVDLAERWPESPEYYNSAIIVNSDGDDVGNYHKSHLYYTDESWALEGSGFFSQPLGDLGQTTIGICMDINPYKFQASWDKFEFATHALKTGARLVVVSMAWITHEDQRSFIQTPDEPDMDTLSYWISRLEPIIRTDSEEEVIVVFANRCGVEEDATYTGTSAVVGVKSGEVRVYGILGRGENKLLVVDTDDQPFAKLVYRPEAKATETGEVQAPNDIDRSTLPRETNGGGRNARASSESLPYQQHYVGEKTSHDFRERGSGSPNKRDDLAVKIHEKNQLDCRYRNPEVVTPSAPSPTPHHFRPQFSQSVDPSEQTRTNAQLPYDDQAASVDEPLIIDPEATARRLGLIRNRSPSERSESQGSNYSIGSSKLYWNPKEQSEVKVTRRPRLDNVEQMVTDFASINFSDDKRHSIRSDIAVWNNEPGHPRDNLSISNTSKEPKLRSTLHSTERNREPSRSVNRSRNGPPGMSSRNDSRLARPDRSVSSILPMPDMVAACERFEEFAQRAETAQGRFEAMREPEKGAGALPQSRAANLSRQRSTRPPSQSKLRHKPSKGSMSVPFAMDPSILRDSSRPSTTLHDRPSSPTGSDPPILRPVSRSRIHREATRGRGLEIDIPITDATLFDHRIHSANKAVHDDRAMSRGRTRSAKPPEIHSADPMRTRPKHRGAHKRHESAQDAIDLAQFNMIEEYPSANCPLHGSRSRSRAGHRTQSRQRTSGTPRTRPQSSNRQGRDIPRSTQNTPLTGNRRAPSSTKIPYRLTTDLSKSSRVSESSVSQGQYRGSGPTSAVPSSASTLSPGQDPKTPIAMVLGSDLEEMQAPAHMSWMPTVKAVEQDAEVNFAQPLSVGF